MILVNKRRIKMNDIEMDDFKLEYPTIERKNDVIDFINEFYKKNSNINGTGDLDRYLKEFTYEEWLEKVDQDYKNPDEGRVPDLTYFFIRKQDNKIVGMINIRLALNEYLRNYAGHIGYSIRPKERGKGYSKYNLYLALKVCKEHNIKEALLFCRKNNMPSVKTIQSLNGELNREFYNDEENANFQEYVIDVEKALEKFKKQINKK